MIRVLQAVSPGTPVFFTIGRDKEELALMSKAAAVDDVALQTLSAQKVELDDAYDNSKFATVWIHLYNPFLSEKIIEKIDEEYKKKFGIKPEKEA